MAEVIWRRRALARLDLILAYTSQFDPAAGRRLTERLIAAGNSLADFPSRGRPASRARRELPTVAPYVLRYRVDGDVVSILDIKHGRQRRN